jgi:hypothetical protein
VRPLDHARKLEDGAENSVARVRSFTGGSPLHTILYGRPENPLVQGLTEMAAIHVRLRDRLGRVVLHGVRPRTSGHLLTTAAEPLPYELVPIV